MTTQARPDEPSRPWDWAAAAGFVVGCVALLLWYQCGSDVANSPDKPSEGRALTLELPAYLLAVPVALAVIYGVITACVPASRTHPARFWAGLSAASGAAALGVAVYLPHTFEYASGDTHIPQLSSLAIALIALPTAVAIAAAILIVNRYGHRTKHDDQQESRAATS